MTRPHTQPDPDLAERLSRHLGERGLVLDPSEMVPYEASARHGGGRARGVLRPATLAQLAGVVRELVDSGAHFVTQGAITGLDWAQLLCDGFGALGIVARATVKLHPIPRQSATALVALDSVETAVDMVCALEHSMGECVSAFEGLSSGALRAVERHQGQRIFAETPPYAVLVEVSSAIAPGLGLDLQAMLMAWLEQRMEQHGGVLDAIVDKPEQLWRIRHAVSESVQSLGRLVAFDVAVPRSAFAPLREEAVRLIDAMLPGARLCDFGHLGDGGVHLNLTVPDETRAQQVDALRDAVYEAVVLRFGGSFSAEHGVGPYNQRFYDAYTEAPLRGVCDALQRALDPGLQLGHVRLGLSA